MTDIYEKIEQYSDCCFGLDAIEADTKALEAYALAHPVIMGFRTEGAPSVSVRKA